MATLLPNGRQTFTDQNGVPLAGGSVTFYVPGTSTPKDTYQDAGATILNTNPVILDAAGQATLYGSGSYRQIVKDALGDIVWDQATADTSASGTSWGGTTTGLPNAQVVRAPNFSSQDGQSIDFIAGFTNTAALAINPNGTSPIPVKRNTIQGPLSLTGGEIVQGNVYRATYDATAGIFHIVGTAAGFYPGSLQAFMMTSAPAGWLACDGSTKNTADYPALFSAIGYLFGGSGSTFSLPGAGGKTIVGVGAPDGVLSGLSIGQSGGASSHTMTEAEMPPHNHGGTTGGQSQDHSHTYNDATAHTTVTQFTSIQNAYSPPQANTNTSGTSNDHTHTIASDGGGAPHSIVQPSLVALMCIKT